MKTGEQIKDRAFAIAEAHFYADVEGQQPWEPFNHYSAQWIAEEVDNMADMLIRAMLWAQGE